ncbi:hypothetical protein BJ165DRAFT_1456443 [Panaeolus papilionaceus]|nr:hypothetical protein BJ165DRAFT_1456443 [Panaeolus papilionaceus]
MGGQPSHMYRHQGCVNSRLLPIFFQREAKHHKPRPSIITGVRASRDIQSTMIKHVFRRIYII